MTETVPTRPVGNTSNGRVPHAQLVPIAVEVATPAEAVFSEVKADISEHRTGFVDHVMALVGSWPAIAAWVAVMLGLNAGSLALHGTTRLMVLTASLVLFTQFCLALIVAIAFGWLGNGGRR